MAGMTGRMGDRMLKDLEELMPSLKEKGEDGLSRMDKVRLQVLKGRSKISSEDLVAMTEAYYQDFREKEEAFEVRFPEEDGQSRRIVKGSFDHLKVTPAKTLLSPKHCFELAEIRVEALDKDNRLCDRWQGDLSIESKGRVEAVPGSSMKIRGGMATFYVKTTALSGQGEVRVRRPDVKAEPVVIRFLIEE